MTEGRKGPTTILRADVGMIRDAWWETSPDGLRTFVVRQIKIGNGDANVKEFRFHGEELEIIGKLIGEKADQP